MAFVLLLFWLFIIKGDVRVGNLIVSHAICYNTNTNNTGVAVLSIKWLISAIECLSNTLMVFLTSHLPS